MSRHALCIRTALILAALASASTCVAAEHASKSKADDKVSRWNDRSNPRKMLETFYFSIFAYDLAPELIVNAIDCMELGDLDQTAKERDAALMAHELNVILTKRSDLPLYGVPEKVETDRVTLVDDGDIQIDVVRVHDGRWRFSQKTIRNIPRMRAKAAENERTVQEVRAKMSDGRTDPETTIRTFLQSALIKRDFSTASQCLDLHDIPIKLRPIHGPEQARKLLFVMQRCGFAFPQEFPSDPDGWRFIWHSNHRGRIMLDRVRVTEGRDAWLFSRMTLRNLDALVEGFKEVPPDPRYARIGTLVDASVLTNSEGNVPPPSHVPADFGSPRATLRTFFEAMDNLEYDDSKAQAVLDCLDLREIPASDRNSVGLRLGAKLFAILRPLNIDLQTISDSWEAEPLPLNPQSESPLTLARSPEGRWRFDEQSISHVPELFKQLSVNDKTSFERRTPFSSARQTMRTLLKAGNQGQLTLASECLNLSQIPSAAKLELGPALAFKLNFVLEHLGRVVVQEIPNESEGPRYFVYRGSLGRISLARESEEPRAGDWLFTAETVAQIDSMFQALLHQVISKANSANKQLTPEFVAGLPVALKIRSSMSKSMLVSVLGICVYQWIGLALIAITSAVLAGAFIRVANLAAAHILYLWKFDLSREFLSLKLRPLGFQVAIWSLYLQLPLLDLPIPLVGQALPTVKFIWVGLLAWSSLRLTDLGMGLYTNSEHLNVRNNLNDMIVPTATRCLKLVVLIVCVCYQVSLIGNGEWLTKMLAGVGLIGLAASLAAQDTLKNFFGTLLLIGEHPFKIGDLIIVNGCEGTVESVGFRSTRIRTAEDSLMTIPNSLIATSSIDNRGMRKCRRYRSVVLMDYETPVDRMIEMRDRLQEIATSRPDIVRADKVDIHIFSLSGSSVELLVNLFFWAGNYSEELEARDWINREILMLAESLGVEISTSTQSIRLTELPTSVKLESGHPLPAPKLNEAHKPHLMVSN